MASKLTKTAPAPSLHSAGIFADRNLDGPEIGTLVIIVDRAKNLPNLKTMGKQNPYCAARLGKEAKKTETDKRGGQTPKWDQELRFAVHESWDYKRLKVSVFNDDKKTDLIGETWIELDAVIRPGGGQGDAWHELNSKGRFAGSIRIELTFYDTRPKEDKTAEPTPEQLSGAFDSPSQGQARTVGPRQQPPVKRRPLPNPTGANTPSAEGDVLSAPVPTPQAGPRSYHTPPRAPAQEHDNDNTCYENVHDHEAQIQGYTASPSNEAYTSYRAAPGADSQIAPAAYLGPQASSYQQDQPYDYSDRQRSRFEKRALYEDAGSPVHFSDDPYALQAVDAGENLTQEAHNPAPLEDALYDHAQRHANVAPRRPASDVGPPHVQSAPVLGPHARVGHERLSFNGVPHTHYEVYSPHPAPPGPTHAASESVIATRHAAPAPPVHRNSVPAFGASSRFPQDVSSAPQPYSQDSQHPPGSSPWPKPLSSSGPPSRLAEFGPEPEDYADAAYPPCRSHSDKTALEDAALPRQKPYSLNHAKPQHAAAYPTGAVNEMPTTCGHSPSISTSYPNHNIGQPDKYVEVPRQSNYARPPILKPRAISPTAPGYQPPQASQTARKSVSPHPATPGMPVNTPPSMPFSPDSFDAYNPHVQNASRRNTSAFDAHEPQPMYTPKAQRPNASINQGPPAAAPPPRRDSEPTVNPDGTITRPDGRTVDASDHLPAHTYAPEPERKGADRNRPSVNINIKHRFGPRDAPSSPNRPQLPPTSATYSTPPHPSAHDRHFTPQSSPLPSTPPSAARNVLMKRSPATSSPLAPSPPAALNSSYSQRPPPVPGKVPLDQIPYQARSGEPGPPSINGSTSALSQEMARIDIGPSPAAQLTAASEARYGGGPGGRARRSRFGA